VSVAKALLKLRENAIHFAAAADADAKRHASVAFWWWDAVEAADTVIACVMDSLMVGLYKSNPVETHSLKAPGFNP
jgi:hypothetical protein